MIYGREPLKPTKEDNQLFGVSYKAAVVQNHDNSEVDRLESIVKDLQTQVSALRGSILTDVDKKVAAAEKRINTRIDNLEVKWNSDMENLVGQLARNNESLLLAINGKPVTSSGTDDAHGGAR